MIISHFNILTNIEINIILTNYEYIDFATVLIKLSKKTWRGISELILMAASPHASMN
jgi:hypothetical protein